MKWVKMCPFNTLKTKPEAVMKQMKMLVSQSTISQKSPPFLTGGGGQRCANSSNRTPVLIRQMQTIKFHI